ncbi:type II secretion system F family protein [Salipiger sp. PrR002]|uniref:type II secretion system F family protein n=1 Tax=Salipiger sp. PrR002 TaxID=2706489 RepID=UPI0013B69876|nr:type II secretion system F family protein [Salipiger sp. PrR002]NDW01107.1 type II secretion system F family protein [Salipiger sp. PrR002]NDW57910.1 type II secretion system F family protein [Salipiger sp. PrR004]
MLNAPIAIYALIFVAVLLVTDTVLRAAFSARRNSLEVRNRLEALKLKSGAEVAYSELLLRRGVGRGEGRESMFQTLRRFYAQTGLDMPLTKRLLILTGLFLAGALLGRAFVGLGGVLNLAFAFGFTFVLTGVLLYRRRQSRIKKLTAQLAPAIDIIVRSLNAGHPLGSAIALVAREMPDPLGSEFGILNDQMTFGLELDQAMLNMIERVGAPELNLLAVTVSVQRGTGGNLSEILDNLAQMIRARLLIKAKIRAISAEGRITAWIMMGFPFFLFFLIRSMEPAYFDPVWESGHGPTLITVGLVIMAIGMIIVRKLVNFDY